MTDFPPGSPGPWPGTALGRRWTVKLPAGLPLLTANQSLHWRPKGDRIKDIRTAAWAAAHAAKVPRLTRAYVVCVVHSPPLARKRDVHNWFLSAKAAVDGALVDTKVLPDDNDRYLTGPDMRPGDPVPGGQLVLKIYEVTPC